jgi:hypothetical protein
VRGNSSEWDTGLDLVLHGTGNVYVTGFFGKTVDFGTGPVTSAGGYDIFLVKLQP